MSEFAENDVEILHEYVSPSLKTLLTQVRAALPAAIIMMTGTAIGPNADLVNQVLGARRSLLRFLEVSAGTIDRLEAISNAFEQREFGIASSAIDTLIADPAVGGGLIGQALQTAPVNFREQLSQGGGVFSVPRTLPGYGGPVPTAAQSDQFLAFGRFMSRDAERRFRERLLRAEAHVGRRRFGDALQAYDELLANPAGLSVDRVKFLAIRAAYAHLARADQRYAAARQLEPEARETVKGDYEAAVDLMDAHAVSPANPLRRHIEAYAAAQLAQLEAGFNALGFRDSYVPILRAEFLLQKAQERVAAAGTAVAKLVQFRLQANNIDSQAAELRLQGDIAAISRDIADERKEIAQEQQGISQGRIDDIQGSLDSLGMDTVVSATGAAVVAVGAVVFGGAGSGPAIIQSVSGVFSSVLGYSARQNELENQLQVLRIEQAIARREERIAELERQLAETRQQFVQEQLDVLGNRVLNADLFYALARLYEDLADRSLAVAIRWAYLYERAVAFKRLKRDLAIIKLDYRTSIPGVSTAVPAPDLLLTDLTDVSDHDVPSAPGQLLEENPISLRERYPLEFSRFLTSGTMDFVISLYDLDKRRPGVFERRLVEVKVQVIGLVPVTGFSGRIIHHGVFTLRDHNSTLPATRFLPTEEQMAEALADLSNGKTQGDPIEGVIPFLLDERRQELSAAPTPTNPNPEAAALALFEGYGETGQWTLEIDGIDLRLVSDVLVTFRIVFPQSSEALQTSVEKLISDYEEELGEGEGLDKTAAFSLRQRFPGAIDDFLDGSATFVLDDSDFPPDITDLRVKAVIAQIVDRDGRGVAAVDVAIAAVDRPFSINRRTGPAGFTEPLDEDIPFVPRDERVAIQGRWNLQRLGAAPGAVIADVRLFYIYEFRSREGRDG